MTGLSSSTGTAKPSKTHTCCTQCCSKPSSSIRYAAAATTAAAWSSDLIDMCQQQNCSTPTYGCFVCLSLVMKNCHLTVGLMHEEECYSTDGFKQ